MGVRCILLGLIFFNISILPQQNLQWINYTNGDYINTILEKDNYLWIGTSGGLLKYNKSTGEKEFFNKGNAYIPSNAIVSLTFEIDGDMWLGTTAGLVKYSNGGWYKYTTSNSGLPSNFINSIAIDENNNKWIATLHGLAMYDDENWIVYDTNNSGLPSNNVTFVRFDNNGKLWIGTTEGLVEYEGTNWTVYNSSNSGLTNNYVSTIAVDSSNDIWVGVFQIPDISGINGGVYRFDGASWTNFVPVSNQSYKSVYAIEIDKQENKWIGANTFNPPYGGGLFIIPPDNSGINYITDIDLGNSAGWVSSIYADTSNTLWIGTSRGIVKYINQNSTHINTSNSEFTTDLINHIKIDNNGNKWFSSYSFVPLSGDQQRWGSLVKFDDNNWTTFSWENSLIPFEGAWMSDVDDSGNVWVIPPFFSSQYPLLKFNGTNWVGINTPGNSEVEYIFADTGNVLWVQPFYDYLYKFENGVWIPVTNFTGNGVQSMIRVNGTLWIGSANGIFKESGSGWIQYTSSNSGLPNNDVRCISSDSNNNLWIATKGGLAKFDGVNWEVYNSSNSPFTNDRLISVAVDANDVVYFGSEGYQSGNWHEADGLVMKNGDQWTIYNIENSGFPSTGMHDYPFNYNSRNDVYSIVIDQLNKVWIATGAGVGVFDKDGVPIPVELTSFTATAVKENVMLNWSTATETNNYGFEIQKMPLKGFWEAIAFLPGHGTTAEAQHYKFTDDKVSTGTYQYRLKQIDFNGSSTFSNIVEVSVGIPERFELMQNYPNPFNPTTKIKFSIPFVETGHAPSLYTTLKVYDVLGNEVGTLVNERKPPGTYEVEFDGRELASGVYIYSLKFGNNFLIKKMILLK
ncbi:two component regulator propeller [bacterium BMS3Abin03]|nr:two component regulator propeller [bacterium BMS3Abin03]